jgi:hypothetical protein
MTRSAKELRRGVSAQTLMLSMSHSVMPGVGGQNRLFRWSADEPGRVVVAMCVHVADTHRGMA